MIVQEEAGRKLTTADVSDRYEATQVKRKSGRSVETNGGKGTLHSSPKERNSHEQGIFVVVVVTEEK